MNGGIINSVTRLHLVGCFYWIVRIFVQCDKNTKAFEKLFYHDNILLNLTFMGPCIVSIFQNIQSTIDSKVQQEIKAHYNNLKHNLETRKLQNNQLGKNKAQHISQFYPRTVNKAQHISQFYPRTVNKAQHISQFYPRTVNFSKNKFTKDTLY